MNALTKIEPRLAMPAGVAIAPEQWRVLTDAIFPSAKTPESITLALDYCRARKLDPFKRAVHIVPMWNSALRAEVETVWPGINELQVTAARTGQWAGMDAPQWGREINRTFKGQVKEGNGYVNREVTLTFPEWCSVTVYRLIGGQPRAFAEPVYWLESYARRGKSDLPNEMWAKRTRGQLHKVAKAASLRAAFPEETGNDYTADEMEGQAIESGGIVIEGRAEQPVSQPSQERPRDAESEDTIGALDEPEARAPDPKMLAWIERNRALLADLPSDVRLRSWLANPATVERRAWLREAWPDLSAALEADVEAARRRLGVADDAQAEDDR